MNAKLTAGLLASALVLGVLLGRGTAGGDEKPKGPGPTDVVSGVPVGYEHSKVGAVTAAASFAKALSDSAVAPTSVRRLILDVMTADDVDEEVAKAAEAAYDVLEQGFGLPDTASDVVWRGALLGYRVRSYSNDSARIELWGVTVVGKADAPRPQAGWGITTVDLRWSEGDWKLASFPELKEGPTPSLQGTPSDPAEFVTAVRDLERLGHVPTQ